MRTQSSAGTGANAGDTTLELKDGTVRGLRCWAIETLTGSVRVFPSLDGTNYASKQLVLSQEPLVNGSNQVTEAEGTFVAVTTAGRMAYFFGEYKALKFEQVGATASSIRVLGAESFGTA